jgi:predicted TIM-barrel fold metal-dependent hydrolase
MHGADVTELPGAIDCDVHPSVPNLKGLDPYLDPYWRASFVERGIDSFESNSYPPNAPLTARADWKGKNGRAASDVKALAAQVFDRWQAGIAICNCLYGVEIIFSEDMARAVARAVNDWIAREWLDRDPRLRASIVVPTQNVEFAVEEIKRCAADRRFVQVQMLAMQETPLGRRHWWPVYAAAERHHLPIALHPGSTYRHSLTSLGWPTYYLEDYAAYAQAFQSQLGSMISEGVFAKFPGLKVVLLESGVTWLPGFMWRISKFWRGVRAEVPWVDRSPADIVRDHVRLTIQPFDAPADPDVVERVIDQLRSDDILLYASDFPHWQFDGDEALPPGLPDGLKRKILVDNPLATYPRLSEDA